MAIEEVINLKTKTEGSSSVKSLKQEIREAQNEAQKLAREFGDFSTEATNAAKRVAVLRDQMGDFQQRVAALNPDRFQAIAGVVQGVAGGIQAATGAMALFGAESEDVQKTLVKVQGAIALAQGVQQILDLKNSFGALAAMIKGPLVAAFSTLKGAIISTGIGLLVISLVALVAVLNDTEEELNDVTDAVDDLSDSYRRLDREVTSAQRVQMSQLKERGATEKEVHEQTLAFIEENIRRRQKERDEFEAIWQDESNTLESRKAALANFRKAADDIAVFWESREEKRAEFAAQQAEKRRQDEAEAEKRRQNQREQNQKEHEARMQKNREEVERLIQQHLKNVQDIEDAFWQAELKTIKNNRAEQDKIAEDFIKNEESRKRGEQARKDYYAKKDKERRDEEKKQEEALVAAKMAGYDATAQLFSNISQLFEKGSAEQKAFAIAQVLVDQAKAIASTIAGATAAAAAGGPAAPFLLGAYIASGLATVAANFKRVNEILGNSAAPSAQSIGVTAPQLSTISTDLPGSDEVSGDMRVYVTEGDISRTQGRVKRNRSVAVI